jgi:hypothetical protein
MMKLGVISDTHNNILNLNNAITILKNKGAQKIIHLGDNYSDIDEIGEAGISRVPGVFSDFYQNSKISNRRIENFAGLQILITHTISSHANDLPDDIKPEDLIQNKKVDIILYGHTHIPDIKKEGEIIFVNPGHLKDKDKKGYSPTFGMLTFTEEEVVIEIYDLKTRTLYKKEVYTRNN